MKKNVKYTRNLYEKYNFANNKTYKYNVKGVQMENLKKIGYIFLIFIITGICVSVVVFGYKKNKDNNNQEKDKVASEIKYIEDQIIDILNKMNNLDLNNYQLSVKDMKSNDNNESSSSKQSSKGSSEQSSSESSGESSEQSSSESSGESSEQSSSGGSEQASKESSSSGGGSGQESSGQDSKSQSGSATDSSGTQKRYEMELSNILSNNSEEIDWQTIKGTMEELYAVDPTMILDLYNIGIAEEQVLNFNVQLDKITKAVQDENKQDTLNELATLYSFLPIYFENLSIDENYTNILKTKSNVFLAYSLLDSGDWTKINEYVNNAITEFSKVMGNITETEKSSNINKSYIILNEFKSAIDVQSKEIFLVKYKNLLEEIKSIS